MGALEKSRKRDGKYEKDGRNKERRGRKIKKNECD